MSEGGEWPCTILSPLTAGNNAVVELFDQASEWPGTVYSAQTTHEIGFAGRSIGLLCSTHSNV